MIIDQLFNSVLLSAQGITSIDIVQFLLCTFVSLLLGLFAAIIYMYRNDYSKDFVVTLAILPAVVQLVIMLVNGNLGAGLAVMGAFTLVRFRSIPGSAKDIAAVFFSMAIGLATGMGFLAIAAIFTVIMGVATILYNSSPFAERSRAYRQLKITVPESLDYEGMFDAIFAHYTLKHDLVAVKTTNMGSLFQLRYQVMFKPGVNQKTFIDELRTRNSNLEIALGRGLFGREEL
ncbi:MAG: DUF4956 domain-containing protein [Coriobacteriaceae bacterium]|nr:DUF4956 domain-containing protein [Coriobacteriaceae bacterium]